jgi:hypothetical protein
MFRGRSSGTSGPPTSPEDRKKREAILDLSKYVNERIRVKFTGGREGNYLCGRENVVLRDVSYSYRNSKRT